MTDPGVEEIEGVTPHGGVKAVLLYYNNDMKPVAKDRASMVRIYEQDSNGKTLYVTSGSMEDEQPSNNELTVGALNAFCGIHIKSLNNLKENEDEA